jgi:glutamine synthetase
VQSLPNDLRTALDLLQASGSAAEWLGPELHAAYVAFKRAEMTSVAALDENEICRRYAEVY